MARIKLIKGASYTGYGISVAREKPYIDVDEATAKKAIASGFFKAVNEVEPEKAEAEPEKEPEEKLLTEPSEEKEPVFVDGFAVEDMNLAQLKSVAKQMGINSKGLKTKADYVIAIEKDAQARQGSETMVMLQEE